MQHHATMQYGADESISSNSNANFHSTTPNTTAVSNSASLTYTTTRVTWPVSVSLLVTLRYHFSELQYYHKWKPAVVMHPRMSSVINLPGPIFKKSYDELMKNYEKVSDLRKTYDEHVISKKNLTGILRKCNIVTPLSCLSKWHRLTAVAGTVLCRGWQSA